MKIVFVTYHPLGFGGAEVSTKFLAEGLLARGHEIVFVSSGDYEGFTTYRLKDFKKNPFFWRHNQEIRKVLKEVIRKENPDLIHVHDRLTSVSAVQTAKKYKIPVIVHFRDYWFACPNSSCMAPDYYEYDLCTSKIIYKHFPKKTWLWNLHKLRYLKKARKIINQADLKFANSKAIQRRLEIAGITHSKVIPILRDLSQFTPNIEGKAFKKNYHLSEKVLTYVGGLTLVKGIMFITQTISKILEKYSDWNFIIVGDGPLWDDVERFIAQKDLKKQIRLIGRVPLEVMPEVYAASDLVVLPSLWEEPLSGILLEAGASCVPVVSSDRGGTREAVVDGKTGFIVSSTDEGAWKSVLLKLMEDAALREKIGKQAREYILKNFSVNVVAEKVDGYYKKL